MATLTLEDFMRISREQTEIYAKQRAEERSEDLNKFTDILENCVQIKIDSALNPVIDRQNQFEEKTEKAIGDIACELAAIKALVSTPAPSPPLTQPTKAPGASYASVTAEQVPGTRMTPPQPT